MVKVAIFGGLVILWLWAVFILDQMLAKGMDLFKPKKKPPSKKNY